MKYASGKHAFGFCDRCAWRYDLDELRPEMEDGKRNGLRVCPDCYDEDHPQDNLGEVDASDPQALYDPRPDSTRDVSTRLFSFNPVGNQDATSLIRIKLGIVQAT